MPITQTATINADLLAWLQACEPSRVLKQPQDVAVGVGDRGHQAPAADVVRRLLHGGARGGHRGPPTAIVSLERCACSLMESMTAS